VHSSSVSKRYSVNNKLVVVLCCDSAMLDARTLVEQLCRVLTKAQVQACSSYVIQTLSIVLLQARHSAHYAAYSACCETLLRKLRNSQYYMISQIHVHVPIETTSGVIMSSSCRATSST
jgi:hypothetical protein